MKKIIYTLFISVLFSCNAESNDSPEINRTEMINILTDLHITEAYVSQLKLNTSNTFDTLSYYKQLVFNKHQITETSFNRALKYYTKHPNRLENIYESVKNKFKEMDLKLPHIDVAENPKSTEIKDSIRSTINNLQPFSKKNKP